MTFFPDLPSNIRFHQISVFLETFVEFNVISLRYQFSNPNHSRYFIYPGSKNVIEPDLRISDDENIFDETDINCADTFGVDYPETTPVGKTHEKQKSPKEFSNLKKLNEKNMEEDVNVTSTHLIEVPKTLESPLKSTKSIKMASDLDSSEDSLVIDMDEDDRLPRKKKTKTRSDANLFHQSSVAMEDSDASEQSLQIDMDVESSSNKQLKRPCQNTNNQQKASSALHANMDIMDSILQDQKNMIDSGRKTSKSYGDASTSCSAVDPKEYIQPKRNHNVTFRTWNFRANERSIRLLVRSSVDTAIVSTRFMKVYGFFQLLCLFYRVWVIKVTSGPF